MGRRIPNPTPAQQRKAAKNLRYRTSLRGGYLDRYHATMGRALRKKGVPETEWRINPDDYIKLWEERVDGVDASGSPTYSCFYCNKTAQPRLVMTTDHVFSYSLGHTETSLRSIVICCEECNRTKGTKTVTEFMTTDYMRENANDSFRQYYRYISPSGHIGVPYTQVENQMFMFPPSGVISCSGNLAA